MIDLFAKRKAPGSGRKVKTLVSEQLDLTEDDLVTVAELACHEPGCPPVETVIAVHAGDGSRRVWKVHKAMADIEEADVQQVLAASDGQE